MIYLIFIKNLSQQTFREKIKITIYIKDAYCNQ